MAEERAKPGRKPVDSKIIDEGLTLMAEGSTPQAAAETLKQRGLEVSWRTLHTARARQRAQDAASAAEAAPDPSADTDAVNGQSDALAVDALTGDPLDIMRSLRAEAIQAHRRMKPSDPKYNPLLTTATALNKAVAMLERERAKVETPEQAEDRRRRAANETREKILFYVEQAEREAAKEGVCVHCRQPLVKA